MAAGENQTEAIVLDLSIPALFISNLSLPAESVPGRSVIAARFHMVNKISLCSIEARAPAHSVDGLEAGR